jgi:translation initiation factor 6 (eIF-6)
MGSAQVPVATRTKLAVDVCMGTTTIKNSNALLLCPAVAATETTTIKNSNVLLLCPAAAATETTTIKNSNVLLLRPAVSSPPPP